MDEGLMPDYDPNAPMGDKQRQAARAARQGVRAGLGNSTYADQAIGAALSQQTSQLQAIMGQYSDSAQSVMTAWSGAVQQTSDDFIKIYSDDVQSLVKNPDTSSIDALVTQGLSQLLNPDDEDTDMKSGALDILRNPGAKWTPQKLRSLGYKQAGAKWGKNVWVKKK
jgi:hypothetical protein